MVKIQSVEEKNTFVCETTQLEFVSVKSSVNDRQ